MEQETSYSTSFETFTYENYSSRYTYQFISPWSTIKAIETHLKRGLRNSLLGYENFQNILIQIEGILTSRPLSPLSNDHADLNPLNPLHFRLQSISKSEITTTQENLLKFYLSHS